MTTYVPAKKGAEYIFYTGLVSQSTGQFQANPTLAAGDFKVSIDGGALANMATLPAVTPAASRMVKFTLSTSEMNGDNITVVGADAAGAEWDEIIINIQTSARQIDDLAFPTISGRSLDVTVTGAAGVDWGNLENPTTTVGLSGTTVKTATDVETDTADIQTRIPAALTTDGNIKADTLRVGGTLQTAGDIIGDTNDIQSRLPAALSGDGFMKADLKSIEDELTSGNNATLNLKQLNIINNAGNALIAQSSGGDGYGIRASGSGTGAGALIQGGLDGLGLSIESANGNAFNISSSAAYAAVITGENGVYISSLNSADPAVYLDGAGRGLEIYGQSNDAVLLESEGGNGDGLVINGNGTGVSITALQDIALSDGTLNLTAIEDTVWDAALAAHQDAGSTGEALGDAGSAGDPWNTALPGAYVAGTAGKIIGDNINATVSSRSSHSAADVLSAADANPIASNVKEVNDVEITGDGSGTPWGPA